MSSPSGDDRAEVLMDLTEANIVSLEEKFAEEIEELKNSLRAPAGTPLQPNAEREINDAINQSIELLEELDHVRLVFLECARTGRTITDTEAEAFKYFGFLVPSSRFIAPSLEGGTDSFYLPPRRSASTMVVEQPETETDVGDVIARVDPAPREATPEDEVLYGFGSIPPPLPVVAAAPSSRTLPPPLQPTERAPPSAESLRRPTSKSPPPPPTMQPNTVKPLAVQERAADEPPSRPPTLMTEKMEEDITRRINERVAQAEGTFANRLSEMQERLKAAEEAHVQAEVTRVRERDQQERSELTKQHQTDMLAVQKELAATQEALRLEKQRSEDLATALRGAQDEALKHSAHANELQQSLERAQSELDSVRSSLAAVRQGEQETVALRKDWATLMKEAFVEENAQLRADVESLRKEVEALRGARQTEQNALEAQLKQWEADNVTETDSSATISKLLAVVRNVASEEPPPVYTLGNCADSEPVDVAVIQLLNTLAFPFPVSLQRLGRGGDYFIDTRVQLKLVGDQVMVRHVGTKGASSYEPLARYLIHLYAPMLISIDRAESASQSTKRSVSVSEDPEGAAERVRQLQEEQRALMQQLMAQQELLLQHQSRLAAGVSPSKSPSPPPPPAEGSMERAAPAPVTPAATSGALRESGGVLTYVVGDVPEPPDANELLHRQQKMRMEEALREWKRHQQLAATGRQAPQARQTTPPATKKTFVGHRGIAAGQLDEEDIERLKRQALQQQFRQGRTVTNPNVRR